MGLHQPLTGVTPTQYAFHAQRQQRLARINGAALSEPVAVLTATPQEPSWEERQKQAYVPWFSMVMDVNGKPRVDMIINAVCRFYDLKKIDLISHRRTKDVTLPRQVAIYLCRILTLRTFPEIGRHMGGRDHTTVLHAFRKIEKLVLTNETIAGDIEAIRAGFRHA